MRTNLIAVAGAAALFCALYGLFWAIGVSKRQPPPVKAPAPEMKAPQPRPKQVWI